MSAENDNPQREEILSQEETDVLLQGIEDGSVSTGGGRSTGGETVLYDFAECERLTRGAMPTLQIINTRIARQLRDTLGELLRCPVEIEAESNVEQRYADFVPTLSLPACLNLVRLAPLPGTMLVVPENRLVHMTVDRFFGGRGSVSDDTPVREFTQVERRMISLLLERVFNAVSDGWEPVMEIEPELIGQEQNPHFAAIASGNEKVLVNSFNVLVDNDRFSLDLVLPRSLLEPIEDLLDSAPRSESESNDEAWSSAVRSRLQDTRIGLQTSLTRTTLRLGDVLSLQPGDVIPVDLPDEVIVEAAGTPVFAARIGVSRNRNAVEILAPTLSNNTRDTQENPS